MVQPEIGDRVTYIDGDETEHRALVVDDCSDAEYVTICHGGQGQLGEDYNSSVESESSVYPHEDLGDDYTATTHAFRPGWE